MGISRNSDTRVVYLDKREYACCHNRAEALRLTSHLMSVYHAKRIAMLNA